MILFILKLLITFIVTGISTTFLGYWVHYGLHQPWALWFYNSHMNHHTIQYPPSDFFSKTYKSAGINSTVLPFIIIFSPIILMLVGSILIGVLSFAVGITILISMIVWGVAHDYFHDQFHLTDSWWQKFSFFLKWRALHYIHHLDMNLNFGIVFFQWDKLFRTFEDSDKVSLAK